MNPQELDNKHDSGAKIDPTASAMAETSAAAPEPAVEFMIDSDGLALSEDSPETPATRRPAARRGTGTRTPSRSASFHSARGEKPPPGKMGLKSKLADLRRGSRSPSPRASVRPHTLMATDDSSTEARLASLEKQQQHDHALFLEVAQAFRLLDRKIAEQGEAARSFEQLAFDLKKDFNEGEGTTKQEIMAGVNKFHQEFQGKMKQVEGMIEALTGHAASVDDREGKVEKCLETIVGQRPAEGQAIEQAFNAQSQEISQVRNIVSGLAPAALSAGIPFTQEMDRSMNEIFHKMGRVEELAKGVAANHERINTIGYVVDALGVASNQIAGRVEGLENSAAAQAYTCGVAGGLQATSCQQSGAGCCSGSGAGGQAGAPSPWGLGSGSGPASSPPGVPGSSRDGDPLGALRAVIGGNNRCHCEHVKELQEKVAALERQPGRADRRSPGAGQGEDPWQPGYPHGGPAAGGGELPGPVRRALPLDLKGQLGAIAFKERPLLDEKLATQEEYKFNGLKGGVAWKGKLERHFISRAPILKDLLKWVEDEDMAKITPERIAEAAGPKLTADQIDTVNAAMWGFLSSAVSGTAETMFLGADMLNGLDAWRILVRYINHGKGIRLETLRREVKVLHLKPITSLDKVEEGVAEFENVMNEYVKAGGTAPGNEEMKSDLLAVLPTDLREALLWKASDEGPFYKFRDMVLTQAAKILMNRRRLPIHAVDIGEISTMEGLIAAFNRLNRNDDDDESDIGEISTVEGLIAAFNRLNRNGRAGGGGGGVKGTIKQAPRAGDPPRRPRRCANCGKEHAALKCPEPPVAVSDRKCWVCEKKGHIGRDCPDKKRPIKAIEDAPRPFFGCIMDEGFTPAKRTVRPTPRPATIADFMSKNTYNVLDEGGDSSTPITESREHGASRLMSQPKAKLRGRDAGGGKKRPAIQQGKQKPEVMTIEEIDRIIRKELEGAEKILGQEERQEANLILDEPEDDELIGATTEKVSISVAMDSGAVDNVIGPEELPCDAEIIDNSSGRHFVGANNTKIEKYGSCMTKLEQEHGEIDCNWQVADVARPLHSLSKVAGPEDGNGKQDILFNNRKGYVVPPGIVDEIMKRVKPVAEYNRKGGLYVAEMVMSSFPRQDQAR